MTRFLRALLGLLLILPQGIVAIAAWWVIAQEIGIAPVNERN